jgi:chromosome segregation ATPase
MNTDPTPTPRTAAWLKRIGHGYGWNLFASTLETELTILRASLEDQVKKTDLAIEAEEQLEEENGKLRARVSELETMRNYCMSILRDAGHDEAAPLEALVRRSISHGERMEAEVARLKVCVEELTREMDEAKQETARSRNLTIEQSRKFVEARDERDALATENAELKQQRNDVEIIAQLQQDRCVELTAENARLQLELDASCNAEELRQVRADNARLKAALGYYASANYDLGEIARAALQPKPSTP